ncbi:E3 ubiquitin-protein ligase MSL2-like [Stylophora pistillata]|uniref:E3 ubiquitin-protein ligase MSL2 n=1 Tax=Stylophora pistillata TaxID=50429 RepID=A0A2B4RF49_STYPI|nr:E3 ubiquitin-protein ligase MSL2-like [Stylophora pistillata]PFX16241.1 E3 ubiquitin-protein ligase MSL2 [Stylophora pistillata]
MNATTLYVEACRCMLSLENDDQIVWDQMFHLLPKLRQALSCRVCRGLLIDPYGSHSCEHHVCKGCLRKKRALTPGCRWCTNLEKLMEDKQARILLACYQQLCEYVAHKAVGAQRLSTQNGEYNKTLAIIKEAATSPISLENFQSQQQQALVPANTSESNSKISPSTSGNFNMATESRVTPVKLPPEIELLPSKRVTKLLSFPTGSDSQKEKKRKRKPFKGSYYNYGKKKKTVRLSTNATHSFCGLGSEKNISTDFTSLDSKTGTLPQKVTMEEDECEEIQVVDNVDPEPMSKIEQKQTVVVTPPGKHRKYKGKVKRCSCGMSSKLQSPR